MLDLRNHKYGQKGRSWIKDSFGEQLEQSSLEWYKVLGIVFSCRNVRTAAPDKGNIFQSNTSLQWNNIISLPGAGEMQKCTGEKPKLPCWQETAAIRQDGRCIMTALQHKREVQQLLIFKTVPPFTTLLQKTSNIYTERYSSSNALLSNGKAFP